MNEEQGRRGPCRGKRLDNGEWVYGDLIHDDLEQSVRILMGLDYSTGTCITAGRCPRVGAQTVGYDTGKRDKHGRSAFAGDLVRILDGRHCVGVLGWCEHDQCYVVFGDAAMERVHLMDFGNLGRPEYFEIIGNIYDTPELLELARRGTGRETYL